MSGSDWRALARSVGEKWPMKMEERSVIASEMKTSVGVVRPGDGEGERGRLVDIVGHDRVLVERLCDKRCRRCLFIAVMSSPRDYFGESPRAFLIQL